MSDFLYEKALAPCGVMVEEISGAEEKSAKVWKLFALQIFSDSDGERYRAIDHMENGAPLIDGVPQRVSISHTDHFMVVATLPKTPDIDLTEVNSRTAMGVDTERRDRRQVLNVADRFLTDEESRLLPEFADKDSAPEDVLEKYVQAWTCKEAIYKAALGEVADWQYDCRILRLPAIADRMKSATLDKRGSAFAHLKDGTDLELTLSTWKVEGHIVTIAYSPKIAKFPTGGAHFQ